ncbi:DUF3888 domain-containing protein [Mesobacillus maritimus]|uniref:DUF3888 domain-containing protein n=1 Tax=Mesobacillus maritimus TaxID=1643336 RepID=A0ABS7K0T8_9BACI|nr:DUF3888 domain-containing protein [Mesobacillus maritimus]MBY0095776.1 DUF3888 domain-containing protein [Mesobacillus maritimus]
MKRAFFVGVILTFYLAYPIPHTEGKINDFLDSTELLYQDMLMTLLGPVIDAKVNDYYSKIITEKSTVYPYQIEVIKAERIGGNRTFSFVLVLDVIPVVGPHIQIGKDRFTFEIAPGINLSQFKLVKFEHLETFELPTHWKHILR